MKTYDFREAPFKVYGVPFFEETGRMERLPEEVRKQLPSLEMLGRRVPGARVCFRTDSTKIGVKVEMTSFTVDIGMSLYSCQSANVYVGRGRQMRYAGLIRATSYEVPVAEGTVEKSAEMEEVTIFLPRNEEIAGITITLDDDAKVEAPMPYKYTLPVVFYGSSITEGGCCSKPANSYNALVCRWLDTDFINLGFSGSARGEMEMADYINTLPMSIFVYDYDHNAPTVEHLKNTHEPFFRRIREAHPDLPVVMMTMPNCDYESTADDRREVIRQTYENAVSAGDKNVWFIDGALFFGEEDRECCTNDTCHPNDLGMYRMAKVVEPVIRKLLES